MVLLLIRHLLVGLWGFIFSVSALVLVLFSPFNPRWVKPLGRLFGRVCLWIYGVRVETRNWDILESSRPAVLVSNHQYNLDLMLMGSNVPSLTVSIGKREIVWLFPIFGLLYWLAGNIVIDRKNKKNALAGLSQAEEAMRSKGVGIWVMPEGTRSRGRGLLPFKKGAFCMAINTQCPVVPVVISEYTETVDLRRWRAGKVIMQALPPISTEGMTLERDLRPLVKRSREVFLAALASASYSGAAHRADVACGHPGRS